MVSRNPPGRIRIALVVLALSYSGGCAGDDAGPAVSNPSFDRWCKDKLCGWETDEGEITSAATWHSKDFGVSFLTSPTQISQLVKTSNIRCFLFDMIADVEAKAVVSLQLDFDDDGAIDFTQQVPDARWKTWPFVVRAPLEYASVRFILRKEGVGRAVLAQMRVQSERDCLGKHTTLRDGTSCRTHAVCESGLCLDARCQRCPAGGCAEGSVCGSDAMCSQGSCVAGRCHACARDHSCPALTPCEGDADCESGRCQLDLAPSLMDRPEARGVCGECSGDEQCPGASCVNGLCVMCAGDAACPANLICRDRDAYDATARACLPVLATPLARAALCTREADCERGLRCEAGPGLPARCGGSCAVHTDCRPELGEVCSRPGAALTSVEGESFWVLRERWAELDARIQTCAAWTTLLRPGE